MRSRRDEALEQHAHPRRVDLGDAERVANRRIRRRAAALAENLLRPRERDDVVDGEEVRLVAELGDQRKLVLDQLAHVRRDAGGIAPEEPGLGQRAQVRRRRRAGRHDLLGIFVAQLVEREMAASRDRDRLREQSGRINRRKPRPRAQVSLPVGEERETAVGDRLLQPDRGDRVLQRAPGAGMHVDVARGDLRQSGRARQLGAAQESRSIAGAGEELDGDPRAFREGRRDPASMETRVILDFSGARRAGAGSWAKVESDPTFDETSGGTHSASSPLAKAATSSRASADVPFFACRRPRVMSWARLP